MCHSYSGLATSSKLFLQKHKIKDTIWFKSIIICYILCMFMFLFEFLSMSSIKYKNFVPYVQTPNLSSFFQSSTLPNLPSILILVLWYAHDAVVVYLIAKKAYDSKNSWDVVVYIIARKYHDFKNKWESNGMEFRKSLPKF